MRSIILVAHNLRSCHNVGSLLRTADGLGVEEVIMSGYTPYPLRDVDQRLPHQAAKQQVQISKTSLGAEVTQSWRHIDHVLPALDVLRSAGWQIVAVEQTASSMSLAEFIPASKVVLIVGREVEGIEAEVLEVTETSVHIPMFGSKESFNVVQAAAMALYHCRFMT